MSYRRFAHCLEMLRELSTRMHADPGAAKAHGDSLVSTMGPAICAAIGMTEESASERYADRWMRMVAKDRMAELDAIIATFDKPVATRNSSSAFPSDSSNTT